jgi:predicted DNA-binding transcriptional regulator YafY
MEQLPGDGRLLSGYLSRGQIADEFGVTQRTLSRWMAQRDGIPFTTVGGRTMFRIASVRAWIESREKWPNPRRHTASRQGEAA